uniref:SET domain-containing protein n=1 Tax=Caenorhabditis tropicalis TaxID=1561998 RepID=A0A1I7UYU1_9PELO
MQKSYKLVVDYKDGAISIVEARDLSEELHREIQDIADEHVEILGTEIDDSAYDENLDIHCDKCNKFYRPFCRMHPLLKIPDRDPNKDKRIDLSYSRKTLPLFFALKNQSYQTLAMEYMPSFSSRLEWYLDHTRESEYKKIRVRYGRICLAYQMWRKKFYIDGSDEERSNWLRFINSPRHEDEQNMLAFQTNGKIFYRVIKPIRVNQELLVWYGASFGGEFVEGEDGKQKKSNKNPFICTSRNGSRR